MIVFKAFKASNENHSICVFQELTLKATELKSKENTKNKCTYENIDNISHHHETNTKVKEKSKEYESKTSNNKIGNDTSTIKAKSISLSPIPYQKHLNTKTMGNFVLDRVSKLMSGMPPHNALESHATLPIIESNKLISKNVYVYNL